MSNDTLFCSHCGGEIPAAAASCRHCGASEESGWNDAGDGYADDDDDFDYDEYVAREFPEDAASSPRPAILLWGVIVIVLCMALLLSSVLFF